VRTRALSRARSVIGWTGRLGRAEPPPCDARAGPEGFGRIRYEGDDRDLTRFIGEPAALGSAGPKPGLKVLALSGGGAGGAFGAGALIGLSQAGSRPAFDTVTGVSTGALMAPFALLGAAWDSRLEAAFTDGYAEEVFAVTSARRRPSLYPGEQLAALVARHVDDELLAAVGNAHRDGRRLFVATANLDAQSTSVWDMGAIAETGGPRALALFRSVLVASASLPGLFPPVLLSVQSDGQAYEEMHVDGGAITPLFVVPETLLSHRAQGWDAAEVEVFALVNTTLEPTPEATPMHAVPILMRSFELMLRSSYRSALRAVAAFCAINDFRLRVASLPARAAGGGLLHFNRLNMTRLFAEGLALGASGGLWSDATDPAPASEPAAS